MKVWLNRTLAWPLLLISLAVICFQAGVVHWVWQTFGHVPPCLRSRTFLTAVLCVEVVVDVFLAVLIARAIDRNRDHSRPTSLFFLWQGAKACLSLLYVALTFSHFPFPHLI